MIDTALHRTCRTLTLGAALVSLVHLTATPASAQAPRHTPILGPGAVFTATNGAMGNEVIVLGRDASGVLYDAGSVPTGGLGSGGGLGNQGGVTLNNSGRLLLVVNAGSDSISVLRNNPEGPSLVDMEMSGGSQPISVTVHEDLVYVLDAGGDGNIAGFHLADDGDLTPIAGSMRALSGSGTGPAQIAFSPHGDYLVVTEKATNMILTYHVGEDGLAADAVASPSAGVTPFGFSFDRRSNVLVSEATGGMPGMSTVSSYRILSDGSLMPITAALGTGQSAACWLIATGNSRHAYVTNTASASVTGLDIRPNGMLNLLDADGYTAPAGMGPIDAAVSRNGRFLYVLNGGDDSIDAYSIGADGGLTPLGTHSGLPASVNGLAAL